MLIRFAAPGDEHGIAVVHVESWQAAYRGLMPQKVLDELSIEQRESGWHEYLHDTERVSRTLVAERDSEDGGTKVEERPGLTLNERRHVKVLRAA